MGVMSNITNEIKKASLGDIELEQISIGIIPLLPTNIVMGYKPIDVTYDSNNNITSNNVTMQTLEDIQYNLNILKTWANDSLSLPVPTFKVNNMDDLNDWKTNAPGNDYTHVLITYNGMSSTDPEFILNLDTVGTKTIIGENNANFSLSLTANSPKTDTIIKDLKFVHGFNWNNNNHYIINNLKNIRDIILDVDIGLSSTDKETTIFKNCDNIANITGKFTIRFTGGLTRDPHIFKGSNYIYNVKCSMHKERSGNEWGCVSMFKNSNYLLKCVVTDITQNSNTWGYSSPLVFRSCNFLWDNSVQRIDNIGSLNYLGTSAHGSCFRICKWMFDNTAYKFPSQPYQSIYECYNSNNNSNPINDTNSEGNNTILEN